VSSWELSQSLLLFLVIPTRPSMPFSYMPAVFSNSVDLAVVIIARRETVDVINFETILLFFSMFLIY
jgi:hypothetical protein